jgi:pyridoxine 5-phosphate synthase
MERIRLGVNVDHVATIREARKALEPDPVLAAAAAERAGADSITVHLREDERHIKYRDVLRLRRSLRTKLNLEMSLDPAVVARACAVRPDQATLVPERRKEITTEGGLDVGREFGRVRETIRRLKAARRGMSVSLFIDPDERSVLLSKKAGADFVEIHTGAYADSRTPARRKKELARIRRCAGVCARIGLGFNAGHGLNYKNVAALKPIRNLHEVNIGHSIVSRAVFTGLSVAVRDMRKALKR